MMAETSTFETLVEGRIYGSGPGVPIIGDMREALRMTFKLLA